MTLVEWRTCQFCKEMDDVLRDDAYNLFKYSVRHYAHAICLAKKHGANGGAAMIPEHQRRDYRWRLRLHKPSGWEMTMARMVDKKRAARTVEP